MSRTPIKIDEAILREREWAKTELGKAFLRFESALGTAWVTDCRPTASASSMERDWKKASEARAALLNLIRGW